MVRVLRQHVYLSQLHTHSYTVRASAGGMYEHCQQINGVFIKTRCSRIRQTSSPMPPLGELDETYASSLIMARSIMWTHDIIHKPEVHVINHNISLPSEDDRAMATSSMCRKFCKIWTRCFWDMQVDRQTDRHTGTLIATLRTPLAGGRSN